MQINTSLLKMELRALLSEPVTWLQAVIFQWLMLKSFALLYLMAGSRGRIGFPDLHLLLGGMILMLLMSIIACSRIMSAPKACGVTESLLVAPLPMTALLDTSVLTCALFNAVQVVAHYFLLARAYPKVSWGAPVITLFCGFCLSTALLFFLAKETLVSDEREVPLTGYLAGCVMVFAVFLIACAFTGIRVSRGEILCIGILSALVLLAAAWFMHKRIIMGKANVRPVSMQASSDDDKSCPAESTLTWDIVPAAGGNPSLYSGIDLVSSHVAYMFTFLRQYAVSVMRMPFVYVLGALPVLGGWLLIQLSAERMDTVVSNMGQQFVQASYGLLGLVLLISIYQCALQFITEEKSNSIMSELVCSPANMHAVFWGRAAGIAIAVVCVCVVVAVVEIGILLPSFLKIFLADPRLFNIACSSFLYAILFMLCALAGEGRHYANIALVAIPVGEMMIAKCLPFAARSGNMPFLIKYAVMSGVVATLYVYFISRTRILSDTSKQ